MEQKKLCGRLAVVAAVLAACGSPARAAAPLPSAVTDGLWQASITRGADAVTLQVARAGAPAAAIENPRFLPPAVAAADGEWRVTGFGVAGQRLEVALRLTGRGGERADWQERRFAFDLSRPGVPLVAMDSVRRRDGRYDVHRFDLAARTASWCRGQATPDLAGCTPVSEALRPRGDVADVGLAAMPSAEAYAPPVVQEIVYGAPRETPVPKPAP